jgi:hypothetical protein
MIFRSNSSDSILDYLEATTSSLSDFKSVRDLAKNI